MAGDEADAVSMIAVRQRNPRVGGGSYGCGDAGHHREIDPRPGERLQLFPATPEDEGIAALEPYHSLALIRVLDQQGVDFLLGAAAADRFADKGAGGFAHADPGGVAPGEIEHRGRYQAIVQNHIGVLQCAQRLERQEFRIAGTCAHQGHLTGGTGCGRGGRQQLLCDTPRALVVALVETPCSGSVHERFEKPPPLAGVAQFPPGRTPQRPQPSGQFANSRGNQRFEPFAQAPSQHRRCAAGRDRHQHRIAVDDGRYDEARRFAIVDDIDGDVARVAQIRDPTVHGTVRCGDDDQTCAVQILGNSRRASLSLPEAARCMSSGAISGATTVIMAPVRSSSVTLRSATSPPPTMSTFCWARSKNTGK